MEIEFGFADDRDWMAWPMVRLRHLKSIPDDLRAGGVEIVLPVSR